jgi:hypothetical protein
MQQFHTVALRASGQVYSQSKKGKKWGGKTILIS